MLVFLHKYIYCLHNKSICPCFQAPKTVTGACLIMFLQALVNKSINMTKQLYDSETTFKKHRNLCVMAHMYYYEVDNVNIASVNNINSGCITNYVTCASGCFV